MKYQVIDKNSFNYYCCFFLEFKSIALCRRLNWRTDSWKSETRKNTSGKKKLYCRQQQVFAFQIVIINSNHRRRKWRKTVLPLNVCVCASITLQLLPNQRHTECENVWILFVSCIQQEQFEFTCSVSCCVSNQSHFFWRTLTTNHTFEIKHRKSVRFFHF